MAKRTSDNDKEPTNDANLGFEDKLWQAPGAPAVMKWLSNSAWVYASDSAGREAQSVLEGFVIEAWRSSTYHAPATVRRFRRPCSGFAPPASQIGLPMHLNLDTDN